MNIQNHPLKVYYPYGGIHYMLLYWTYNERGHIVLSKSEKGLKTIAEKILSQDVNTEIKAYQKINIVAPTKSLCEKSTKLLHEKNVDDFVNEISNAVFYNFEKSRFVPFGLQKCKNYEYSLEEFNGEEPNKWSINRHNECKNCINRINFNLSKEEIYNKYFEAWRKIHPFQGWEEDNKLVYSVAEEANDSDILYRMKIAFGHHCDGLLISDANLDSDWLFNNPALFYFHKLEDLDYSEYIQFLEDLKEKEIENKKQREINFLKSERKEQRNKVKQLRKFFEDFK